MLTDFSFYNPKILRTGDGSSSLLHPVLNEWYHSRHGAWTESRHIYIDQALIPTFERKEEGPIRIFEMGFGSGLNGLLTWQTAIERNRPVRMISIEKYPVEIEIADQMVFPFPNPVMKDRMRTLHAALWNEIIQLDPYFTIHKIVGSFPEDVAEDSAEFDIIYYDAFAPGAQPELWEVEALKKCYYILRPGGIWISFSSSGSVQRNLKEVGFRIEKLPGPPGKQEITRAVKEKM